MVKDYESSTPTIVLGVYWIELNNLFQVDITKIKKDIIYKYMIIYEDIILLIKNSYKMK